MQNNIPLKYRFCLDKILNKLNYIFYFESEKLFKKKTYKHLQVSEHVYLLDI